MKKILITGGAGFLGSHLVRSLKRDYLITVVDILKPVGGIPFIDPDVTFINADIRDLKTYKELAKYKFDAIFHLAAQSAGEPSYDDPHFDINTNIYGTYMVCKYAVETNVKHFLYTSSVAVYGTADGKILTEKNIIKPDSIYGISKYSGEMYIRLLTKNSNTNYTIFRVFNTYGPGENLNYNKKGMVSIYASYLWKNKPIKVKGSIDRYRDFTFIDDSVSGMTLALFNTSSFQQIFNLTNGEKVSIKDLIKLMILVAGKEKSYPIDIHDSTPGDSFGFSGSNEKIKKLLGWSPSYDLRKGLNSYFRWINKVPITDNLLDYHPFKF